MLDGRRPHRITHGTTPDVYDALRRARAYKKALPHDEAVRILLLQSAGQFDPDLLKALEGCHPEFERAFADIKE